MAHSQAEQVREILGLLSEGHINEALAKFGKDAEWDASRTRAIRQVYRGREEVRRGFESFREAWAEHRFEPQEIAELAPDLVLAVSILRGRGRGSGIEVTAFGAQLWSFRDGRPWKLASYKDRDEALRSFRESAARRPTGRASD